jgi:DNA-binding transcriptional LysR family regulator
MRSNSTIGAQKNEQARGAFPAAMPDWESVRIFLEVARSGSFRTAATHLNMTGHGVAHRIVQLEHQVGTLLFTRHRDGVRLTEDGRHLLSCAEQMEEASLGSGAAASSPSRCAEKSESPRPRASAPFGLRRG